MSVQAEPVEHEQTIQELLEQQNKLLKVIAYYLSIVVGQDLEGTIEDIE